MELKFLICQKNEKEFLKVTGIAWMNGFLNILRNEMKSMNE